MAVAFRAISVPASGAAGTPIRLVAAGGVFGTRGASGPTVTHAASARARAAGARWFTPTWSPVPRRRCRPRNVERRRIERASQRSLSMNFSGSSVIPPHKTMRSGHSRACISFRTRLSSEAHASQLKFFSTLTRPAARSSASWPRTCKCPNSVFGTSFPSTNSALPIPVPRVSNRTVPATSRAAP